MRSASLWKAATASAQSSASLLAATNAVAVAVFEAWRQNGYAGGS